MNAPVKDKPQTEIVSTDCAPAHMVFRDFVRALERLAIANEKRAARAAAVRRRRVQA
jgi:hypothetical protein